MSDRKADIRAHLGWTRAKLMEVVNGLDEAGWETLVQGEEGIWTARNVLAHLTVSEAGMVTTIRGIAEGGPGVPETFDLTRYNRSQVQKRQERTVPELLGVLDEARAATLVALDGLDEEQLDRVGRHASGQMMSVEEIFRLIGDHEVTHAGEIGKAMIRDT